MRGHLKHSRLWVEINCSAEKERSPLLKSDFRNVKFACTVSLRLVIKRSQHFECVATHCVAKHWVANHKTATV